MHFLLTTVSNKIFMFFAIVTKKILTFVKKFKMVSY